MQSAVRADPRFNPSSTSIPPDDWKVSTSALLSQVRCLTLYLAGREDPIVPVSVMQEAQILTVIGIVPRFGLQGVRNAALVGVPLGNPEVMRGIGIIRRRDQSLPPAVQVFRDLLPPAQVALSCTSKMSQKAAR